MMENRRDQKLDDFRRYIASKYAVELAEDGLSIADPRLQNMNLD